MFFFFVDLGPDAADAVQRSHGGFPGLGFHLVAVAVVPVAQDDDDAPVAGLAAAEDLVVAEHTARTRT